MAIMSPETKARSVAALKKGAPVYVMDLDGQSFSGVITFEDLHEVGNEQTQAAELARSVPTMLESDNLATAIAMTSSQDVVSFPVLSGHEERGIAGFVTVKKIMNAYQGVLDRVVREDHSFLT